MCGVLTHNTLLMPAFALPCAPALLPVDLPCTTARSPTTASRSLALVVQEETGGDTIQSFGDDLSPVGLSAPHHSTSELLRTLSRMAASKPTSWLSGQHDHLSHYRSYSGTLAVGLGCFPLDDESSHPPSHFRCALVGIRGLVGVGKRLAPSPIQLPTSHNATAPELNLNPFRGEPAISGFDWHFTPTHSSSVQFCNTERFAPPVRVTGPSHWPWVAHPVSGLLAAMCGPPPQREVPASALFGLAFAAPPVHPGPEATTTRNSPAHSSIGTPSGLPRWLPRGTRRSAPSG